MTNEDIARVCHEANRALQIIGRDPAPSPAWDDAPQWQRDSAVEGVEKARAGQCPEQLHESWCEAKVRDGWVYGPVKDAEAKTHPCLVPYAELPDDQRVKDSVFAAIVAALSAPAMSDLAAVVDAVNGWFSEYGSPENAKRCLRYFRALGVPDEEMRFILEVAS